MQTVAEKRASAGAAAAAARRARKKTQPWTIRILPPVLFFVAIIGVWYLISYVVLDPARQFLLPPPQDVIIEGFLAEEARADIFSAAWESLKVAVIGLAIAFVLGSVQAVLMSQAKWIENMLYPYAVFLQTIPTLAIVPVIGFWFGYELAPRVIVCVIIAIFPLIINPLKGLLGADRGLHDLMTLKKASRWKRLTQLQIPSAMPDVFTGLQSAAGLAVVGAVVGDYFFGRGAIGLGLLISRYSARLQAAEMLATVLVACALGLVMFWIFGLLGRRIVGRWSDAWA
ncbi:ABC transporter permease [Herbiconiux moechotypicola]|uniref:ABC transporter permease n=1 Tax=Herbiconiux moechotypicola TaxID=637393 RepID=A0ABP5QIW0_9MICO|nr:ABC transporter permease [Herbiconiux moechotypicola]MCS5730066.1 ABC transporter permease [Herbiconiux moechotypicola]